jgi:hypothetical protein
MRLPVSLLVCALTGAAAAPPYFNVLSDDAGAWPEILSSIGLQARPAGLAHIFVTRAGASGSSEWSARVEGGAVLILEGESSLAESFGFRRGKENVRVSSLTDVHDPKLRIVWEKGLELPVFELPEWARVFARERWTGAPMIAGARRGAGSVLWVAVPPGERGYERFPYLLQALCDLGVEPPFRAAGLWAFFDSGYRARVDVDYFARRWRKAGISALHVAAWHFYEPDSQGDAYLRKLIEACHREGILVYAWLELPHVSEKFWKDHPEWREKTAAQQDAVLDWRKLMNLTNRDCFKAASDGVRELLDRFDWDGVNLAELYFESLEGINNASRFTPMNDEVRNRFRVEGGFDPLELFGARRDGASTAAFLGFRRDLAARMEEEWLGVLEAERRRRADLDLVLTHVDDRLDKNISDAIGADASRALGLLENHNFTFLIEDPATVWHLGAQRYKTIGESYQALTSRREKLAIDLNIVERYQNVYPTKQQTGTELFQLVHQAAANFGQVALYFENSLLTPDWTLLPAAAATVTRTESVGRKTVVESLRGVGLHWQGPAIVDGQIWPAADDETVWLPAGAHSIEPASSQAGPRLVYFNGELKSARYRDLRTVELSYGSSGRAIALLDRSPVEIQIDGADTNLPMAEAATVILPRGQHVVEIVTK